MVEHFLAKEDVGGSNPLSRSILSFETGPFGLLPHARPHTCFPNRELYSPQMSLTGKRCGIAPTRQPIDDTLHDA